MWATRTWLPSHVFCSALLDSCSAVSFFGISLDESCTGCLVMEYCEGEHLLRFWMEESGVRVL